MSVEVITPADDQLNENPVSEIDSRGALPQDLCAVLKIGEIVRYSCMRPPCVDPGRCSGVSYCVQGQ